MDLIRKTEIREYVYSTEREREVHLGIMRDKGWLAIETNKMKFPPYYSKKLLYSKLVKESRTQSYVTDDDNDLDEFDSLPDEN